MSSYREDADRHRNVPLIFAGPYRKYSTFLRGEVQNGMHGGIGGMGDLEEKGGTGGT